ncbi:MAG TPA: hemolysin III family protein [Chloroflexota bacterium]|nr:hemolysin III family protein [Chloroflexota bacterium]
MPLNAGPAARPRWRGLLHQYAFLVSVLAGAGLVLAAPTPRATLAAAVYALTLAGLFGASALYHRVTWAPGVRRWLRRVDHAMIFLLIAGTYTPFALLVLTGQLAAAVLAAVWAGAVLGVLLNVAWIDAPKWATAAACAALGWASTAVVPEVVGAAGLGPLALLVAGGVLYTTGALVYLRRWPNPAPAVFGYHELFHALVVAAAAAHFAAVAVYALPRG